MTVEDQATRFEHCVDAFAASVMALDDGLFLSKVDGWTPRDIVAHLTGWNRHIVIGAQQILRGELPFYDVDPGPNYSKVNAAIVSEYDETDRSALLDQLAQTAGELKAFLRVMDPEDWDRDFGVRHKADDLTVDSMDADVVTVKNTVDELIADYDHHRKHLESLRAITE